MAGLLTKFFSDKLYGRDGEEEFSVILPEDAEELRKTEGYEKVFSLMKLYFKDKEQQREQRAKARRVSNIRRK